MHFIFFPFYTCQQCNFISIALACKLCNWCINCAISNLKMKVPLVLLGIVFLLTSNVHQGKVSHPAVDMYMQVWCQLPFFYCLVLSQQESYCVNLFRYANCVESIFRNIIRTQNNRNWIYILQNASPTKLKVIYRYKAYKNRRRSM